MKLALIVIALAFLPALVFAQSNHSQELEEGKALVASGVSCSALSDKELEEIGEYLMEQMHPGASHDAMHELMGLQEGTAAHDAFHISLAKRMYCGEISASGFGMMNNGMMGGYGGMMKGYANSSLCASGQIGQQGFGMPMMMNWQNGSNATSASLLFWLSAGLWLLLLTGLVALVFLGVFKLWKDLNPKNHAAQNENDTHAKRKK